MGLSATPRRPACPSRASGWPSLITHWGFPCCARFPCVHAAATTPVQRLGVVFARLTQPCQPSPVPRPDRPAHRPFRGLLSVYSRCGLHTRAVTKVVTVTRRLQTFRLLHACSGCFRLERSPGGACTRWISAALSRRTWISVLAKTPIEPPKCAESGHPFNPKIELNWLSRTCGTSSPIDFLEENVSLDATPL